MCQIIRGYTSQTISEILQLQHTVTHTHITHTHTHTHAHTHKADFYVSQTHKQTNKQTDNLHFHPKKNRYLHLFFSGLSASASVLGPSSGWRWSFGYRGSCKFQSACINFHEHFNRFVVLRERFSFSNNCQAAAFSGGIKYARRLEASKCWIEASQNFTFYCTAKMLKAISGHRLAQVLLFSLFFSFGSQRQIRGRSSTHTHTHTFKAVVCVSVCVCVCVCMGVGSWS